MEFRFQNLGTIKYTELDLKPLTVIIGPNNSNKTYVAYSVYGLINNARQLVSRDSGVAEYRSSSNGLDFSIDASLVRRLLESVSVSGKKFSQEAPYFFHDTSMQIFRDVSFDITASEREFLERIRTALAVSVPYVASGFAATSADGVIRIEPSNSLASIDGSTQELNKAYVQLWLATTCMRTPILLPAERNALVITYKTIIARRYRFAREARRALRAQSSAEEFIQIPPEILETQEDFHYPEPVEDFLEFLNNCEQLLDRAEENPFSHIASLIEQSIQNGNRTVHRSQSLGAELAVQVDKNLTIELYNASSSIKQLAPLIIYLRKRATANDLLIIDEPEMNLHPESQAKLLEAIALMVNAGLNVLLTTHSPYILQHLNNLVYPQPKSEKAKSAMARELYLKDAGALLRPDQVSPYEMKDGNLVPLWDDGSIRWDTFSDVSIDLQQKFFKLAEEADGEGA